MNPRTWNLKWALAFAGAVVVGVLGVVLVLTLMRGGDDQATAQSDSATATPLATLPPETVEATVAPTTPGSYKPPSTSYPIVVPTPPKGFTLGAKRPCPEGWGQISDDMAVYSICIPPGWGMPVPDSDAPVASAVLHYGNPEIYSPEAFPWLERDEIEVGKKIGNPDAAFVRVILFPATWRTDTPAPTVSNTCEAEQGASIAGLPAAACEYRYDRDGGHVPNPLGSWCGRLVFVSLPSAKRPEGFSTDKPYSAVLGIIVAGRCEVVERYRSTLSEILSTLQVVP
jgi:hypothetical protein